MGAMRVPRFSPANVVGPDAGQRLQVGDVVHPDVNAVGCRSHRALVDLRGAVRAAMALVSIGILLPVAVTERPRNQEGVIDAADLFQVIL